MFKDTIELKNTLIDWLYETIDQYYLEEIEEIVDDNSDKIYINALNVRLDGVFCCRCFF